MGIKLLGPPDDDGNRAPLRKWYSRKLAKPYETANTGTSPSYQISINLRSPVVTRGLEDSEYVNSALKLVALDLILDYYGKAELANSLNLIVVKEIHFPSRSLANPIVQFSVDKTSLLGEENLQVNMAGWHQELIEIRTIKSFLRYVGTAFKVYQQQLPFFSGSVAPNINFLDLLDKVKLFFNNLENFAAFNQYELHSYSKVVLVFNEQYEVIAVQLLDKELKQYPLTKGTKYYFSTLKQGSNKYVNEIITNFTNILAGRQSKINWTQFIHEFLPNSGITVNYYGTPRTETEAHRTEEEFKSKSPFGPMASLQTDVRTLRAQVNNRANQEKAFKEAQKTFQKEQENLNKRIAKIVDEIQNVTDEANKISGILSKYNITTLIEAALECLLFKSGFNGSVPDFIPGISPFDPVPPKIDIRFPAIEFELPIISINKVFQVQIREGMKRAAIGAVMALIQAIADIIKEICLSEPSENDTVSMPPQDLIGTDDGADSPLYQCYEDFGFALPSAVSQLIIEAPTSGDLLEEFLSALAPLITARELCDLFGGVADAQVFQVINNLIDQSFPVIRPFFPYSSLKSLEHPNGADLANEMLAEFFMCLGNLIDPSYCAGVYNDLIPTLPVIDPCTIEDTQPFQDIMDLLDGINEIYDPMDMNCNAGIIPALSDIASYNHAVLNLIDSVVRPAQVTFVNDLGNFKTIIVQPDPFTESQQGAVDRLEELLKFMRPPYAREPAPAGINKFFEDLIPTQITETFTGMSNIVNGLNTLTRADATLEQNLKDIMASRRLQVAPATRILYEEIEAALITSKLFDDFNPDDLTAAKALKYYSFLMAITLGKAEAFGRTLTYNITGTSLAPDEADKDPSVSADVINIYNSHESMASADLTSSTGLTERYVEAMHFRNSILTYAASSIGNSLNQTSLTDTFAKKLYPFMYFSLFNLCAYRISNSDLFDPDKMNKLNLFPRLCEDGSISNADLLDTNKIKREAMEEFVNNSCIEGDFALGPVRDAGLLALVNTYLQVIVVDMLLKNIFMVSEFGISYLSDGPEVINEMLQQATSRIVLYMAGEDAVGETANFPEIVKKAAAIAVRKIITRKIGDDVEFTYPITGAPTSQFALNLLQSPEAANGTIPISNTVLQNISLRYLFEKRLLGTSGIIEKFFNVGGTTPVETYIINGMPHVELADFTSFAGAPLLPAVVPVGNPENLETLGVIPSYTPSGGLLAFLLEYNYLEGLQGSETIESETGVALLKERDAYEKFGGIVAERLFEIEYSPNALGNYIEANKETSLMANFANAFYSIMDLFESFEPISTATVYDDEGNPSTLNRYILSFQAFKDTFGVLTSFAAISKGGFLPVPFYLAGFGFDSDEDPSKFPLPSYIEVSAEDEDGTEYKSQDGRHMSDYDLIRAWWVAMKDIEIRGMPYGNINAPRPIYSMDGLFSPTNSERMPAWGTNLVVNGMGQDTIMAAPVNYPGGDEYTYAASGNNLPLNGIYLYEGVWWDAAARAEALADEESGDGVGALAVMRHAPGNFLFNIKLFDGLPIWGPQRYVVHAESIFARELSQDDHELFLESKNFKIVLKRPDLGMFGAPEKHHTFLMIRKKGREGVDGNHQGGDYSSIDFYKGSGDIQRDKAYWESMERIFQTYETEEELVYALQNINTAVLDQEGAYQTAEQTAAQQRQQATAGDGTLEALTKLVFPTVSLVERLTYLTPLESVSYYEDGSNPLPVFLCSHDSNPDQQVGGACSDEGAEQISVAPTNTGRTKLTEAHKSFFVVKSASAESGPPGAIAHIATDKRGTVEITDDLFESEEFTNFLLLNGTTQGFSRFIQKFYTDNETNLARAIAASSQDLFGPSQLIDVSKVLQYLYITGEIKTYYSLFADEDIFTDTKQVLLLAIQAAFAGSDTTATSNCDVDALNSSLLNGASNALSPIADIGQSFLNKALKESPKYILKGLVELCEPHVIVSSQIKKISKQVFQGMEQAQNMAQMAADIANGVGALDASAGLGLRPSACDDELGINQTADSPALDVPHIDVPTLDQTFEYIRQNIDRLFPEDFPDSMKPQISKEGLDLEGSIPYTFVLPPITPFGIIYLLMRLGELGQSQVVVEPDCSED